jgi:hypothetical protein
MKYVTMNLAGTSCTTKNPFEFVSNEDPFFANVCDAALGVVLTSSVTVDDLFGRRLADWCDPAAREFVGTHLSEDVNVFDFLRSNTVVDQKMVSWPNRRYDDSDPPSILCESGSELLERISVDTLQAALVVSPSGVPVPIQAVALVVHLGYQAWLLRAAAAKSVFRGQVDLAAMYAYMAASGADKDATLMAKISELVDDGATVMFQEASDAMLALLSTKYTVHTSRSAVNQTCGIILPTGTRTGVKPVNIESLESSRLCAVVSVVGDQSVLLVSLHGAKGRTNAIVQHVVDAWDGAVVIGMDANEEQGDVVRPRGWHLTDVDATTCKTRTFFQAQPRKADVPVRRASDYVLTSLAVSVSQRIPDVLPSLPTREHPTDHAWVAAYCPTVR